MQPFVNGNHLQNVEFHLRTELKFNEATHSHREASRLFHWRGRNLISPTFESKSGEQACQREREREREMGRKKPSKKWSSCRKSGCCRESSSESSYTSYSTTSDSSDISDSSDCSDWECNNARLRWRGKGKSKSKASSKPSKGTKATKNVKRSKKKSTRRTRSPSSSSCECSECECFSSEDDCCECSIENYNCKTRA
ncbi:hypothetical protein KM043_009394 [Ampulex compressa]|nr:hypothetical protein KM043_009394 [Ampulex compressa]